MAKQASATIESGYCFWYFFQQPATGNRLPSNLFQTPTRSKLWPAPQLLRGVLFTRAAYPQLTRDDIRAALWIVEPGCIRAPTPEGEDPDANKEGS